MSYVLLGLSAGEVFKWIGYFVAALVCLMVMIIIHELGHYTAGKIFKFKINEFAIGFGPAIFKHTNKKNGEIFSLRCLPFGGFCAFAGEDEKGEEVGDFNSKPVWQRIIVLFSGAFFNFISAIIIISVFFMSYGEYFPTVGKAFDLDNNGVQIEQVLHEEDIILRVDGKRTYSLLEPFVKLSKYLENKESAVLEINRGGEIMQITVQKGNYIFEKKLENGQIEKVNQFGIGVSLGLARQKLGFFESIGHAFAFCFEVIGLIFRTIGGLFTGALKVKDTMGGTVTAITSLAEMTKSGFPAVMYGVCVLSASLAIMNLLPIPALDGSRIIFCIIEAIKRKPINRKIESIINTVGLVLLLALAITLDLIHFLA